MSPASFTLRQANPSDESFIYNSWLKSYKNSDFARSIPARTYYAMHHLVIERILSRPSTQVLVACDPTAPDVLYGYVVMESVGDLSVVHYCYVKQAFRRLGIASALLASAPTPDASYSHRTKDVHYLVSPSHTFNPYLL